MPQTTTAAASLLAIADLLKAAAGADEQASTGERAEDWAEPIERDFVRAGQAAREDASSDAQRLVANWQFQARAQAQRRELRLLVRQHYVSRLTPSQQAVFWAVPQGVAWRWRELGLLGPVTPARPLLATLDDMAEAARLADLLHRHLSYTQMRQMARDAPTDTVSEMALHIANETLTTAIERMASRHGEALSDLAVQEQRKHYLHLLSTLPNSGYGKNARLRLARDMAELFDSPDVSHDWQLAAVTTTRYAYNLGLLTRFLQQGVEWVSFYVHPDACDHCKRLLLWPDGAPRAFVLKTLWSTVASDGGMNIGRKAALIGHPDGWQVTVIQHPWCRCSPRKATRREIERSATGSVS